MARQSIDLSGRAFKNWCKRSRKISMFMMLYILMTLFFSSFCVVMIIKTKDSIEQMDKTIITKRLEINKIEQNIKKIIQRKEDIQGKTSHDLLLHSQNFLNFLPLDGVLNEIEFDFRAKSLYLSGEITQNDYKQLKYYIKNNDNAKFNITSADILGKTQLKQFRLSLMLNKSGDK